jgi:arsenite/tail-anchored protein-transporting ATPase
MPPEPVDVVPLLSAAKVTVVAGKGGVGKTTVTALLARAAADAGGRVIAVELDGKSTLAELVGDVPLLALSAPLALEEYLREHGFGRVAKRLAASGVIDVVSTAAPGIDDLVVLGKIKQLERSGDWDTIVVDGPAAGHAVTMLTSPAGLRDAVTSGPVRAQADDVLAMLGDAGRCQVALVTLAETTPVNETIETAFTIEDRVGVKLAPVFVNAVDVDALPADISLPTAEDDIDATIAQLDVDADTAAVLGDSALFRGERRRVQQSALDQLEDSLPLDQLHVPYVAGRLDGAAVARLARDVRRGPMVAGTGPRAGR